MRLVASEMVVDWREAGGSAPSVSVNAKAAQNDLPRLLVVRVLQNLFVQDLKVVGQADALQRLHLNETCKTRKGGRGERRRCKK